MLYCEIMNEIKNQTLIECRNKHCNAKWKMKRKGQTWKVSLSSNKWRKIHLNNDECSINNEFTISRKENCGPPSEDTEYNNRKVIYDINTKRWICKICNFSRDKYNRTQVMNHVNAKHNDNNLNPKPSKRKNLLMTKAI